MKKGETVTIKESKPAKTNLFAKAKGKGETKAAKKDDKVTVVINDKGLFGSLTRYEEIAKQEKTLKAEKDGIYDEIKETGKEQMIKLYNKEKRFPGSFNIMAKNGAKSAQFMFITQDSYKGIDEDRAEELVEEFGDSIVSETTTFSLNSTLVEKYSEALSEMIMNSKDIDEDDKEDLIQATTTYKVAPGTIDNLSKMKSSTEDILEEIRPTFQVKGVKTVK